MDIKTGARHKVEIMVEHRDTATVYGSGSIEVFATPALAALMEKASMETVRPFLEDGYTTVGTRLDIRHIAATPVGMKVTASAEIIEADNRRIVFKVEAYDDIELIGEGIHERFIVNSDRFLAKANKKLQSI